MISGIEYKGWQALALNAGKAELVIPTDIGPRVMSCGLTGGGNLFCNLPEEMGGKGEDEWLLRGGHRLWTSPEAKPRSYELDNSAIEVERLGDKGVNLTGKLDPVAGFRKAIRIEVVNERTFKVTHTIINEGNAWPVESAPWALSVMAIGGYMVIPLMPKGSHDTDLLPNYTLIPWTYTDFTHPVWDFHRDYIGVDTTKANGSQKLGLSNYPGWAAYWQEAGTFAVYAEVKEGGRYPDFGSCFEVFSCDIMAELETLGELKTLEPGESTEHVEYWGVFEDLPKPDNDEAFNESLKPAVENWIKTLSK